MLLCLHAWGVEDHPSLLRPDAGTVGNGLLLFFRVDDFEPMLKRGRALVARLEEAVHLNPNTGTEEFSVRDPDGYYVTVSALGPGVRSTRRRRVRAGGARSSRPRRADGAARSA